MNIYTEEEINKIASEWIEKITSKRSYVHPSSMLIFDPNTRKYKKRNIIIIAENFFGFSRRDGLAEEYRCNEYARNEMGIYQKIIDSLESNGITIEVTNIGGFNHPSLFICIPPIEEIV